MVSMRSKRSFHTEERNDNFMHTVLEVEVHRSVNGYALIQSLGIGTYSNFDS